jgi:glycosyltransferase involved in cell wall biosynthesis
MPRPSISLVIAAYNESATLESVYRRCREVLSECSDDFEVVILDDASTDETGKIAARLAAEDPDVVRVLTHAQNQGIAVTFEDLNRAATREWVFDIPADGEYPPEALHQIVPLLGEFDIVVCNRTFKRYTFYRRVVSWLYRLLPRLLFGVELFDPGSTKCRRRVLIEEISPVSRGVFIEAERMIRAARRGHRVGKVDVEPERRLAGDPRGASLVNVVGAAVDLARLWWHLVLLRRAP